MKPSPRWLDIAIKAVLALIVLTGAYLGYSVWAHQNKIETATPAGRALRDLQAYVKKNPNDPAARVALAQALLSVNRRDDALDQYREALRIDKKHTGALSGLGLLAMAEGQYTTAEGHWRKLIEILEAGPSAKDPRLEQAYFYLGQTLLERREYEDSVGYLREALRIRPDASDTHYTLAVAYRELDSTKKQRQELETTLAFDPMMPEANYDLGLLLLAEGDKAGAAERFRLSADKAPEGVTKPQDELKKFGTADERFATAKSVKVTKNRLMHGRIALALDPNRIDIALFVADLYEKSGQRQEAQDLYERVLERDTENTVAKKAIARLKRG